MDSLLIPVEELLREVADREVMTRFRRLDQDDVRTKARQGDLVTVADLEAEHHIRVGLAKLLPDSIVVGEEAAYKKPEILKALDGDKPVWVIDPIDGTRNYAHGKACFAIIVALIVKGETRLGWIYDPISNTCALSEKGAGAYVSGRKCTIADPDGPQSLRGSVGEGVQKRLAKQAKSPNSAFPGQYVRYHCVGREYMDYLLGKLHFGLYGGKLMPWDHAAGCLMVTEAGGIARTSDTRADYDPRHHGHGERLLIASSENTFKTLCPLLIPS